MTNVEVNGATLQILSDGCIGANPGIEPGLPAWEGVRGATRTQPPFIFTATDIASRVSSGVRVAEIAVWAKKTIYSGWDREMPVYGCASVVLYHISRWPGQPIPSRNGQTPSENRLKSLISISLSLQPVLTLHLPVPQPNPAPPLGKKLSSVHHIARSPHLEWQLNLRGHFGEIQAPKDFLPRNLSTFWMKFRIKKCMQN